MTKIKGFAISGLSGHAAKLVFYNQFGKQLMRGMPTKYDDKNSTLQQNQRSAVFSPMQSLASWFKGNAKFFYETQPSGLSAFSKLMSQLRPALGGTKLSPTVNLKLALCGSGSLPRKALTTAVKDTTEQMSVEYSNSNDLPGELATDLVYFIVSKPDGSGAVLVNPNTTRADGTAVVVVPADWTGTSLNVSNPIFVSADGLLKSEFYFADSHSPVNLA